MTKEERIQEVYGEYFEICIPDKNGWSLFNKFTKTNICYKTIEVTECGLRWRPKFLQGIENNFGWTKIESEEDLPKETEIHYHGLMDGNYIVFNLKSPINTKALFKDFIKDKVTHYQPIQKPELPLY